ncbi:MAG: LCP family protein [Oscillospiraceae bacterium]|nr:LCP family protein [Oscillospiraceae bacterium]
MKEKERKPVSAKKIILIVLSAVLAVVLIAMIGASAYIESMLGKLNRDPNADFETMSESEYNQMMDDETTDSTEFTGEEMDATSVVWDEETLLAQGESVINLLLIGQDRRPGQKKNARSDAMILVTINKVKKTITLSSFMRDMYVQIPGKNDNRINASYAMGGISLLNKTITKNFGVTIDGNIVVDFAGFMDAIDIIGGVDISLTKKEADYLNSHTYKDQEHWPHDLVVGMNHLDANKALAYARIRKISGGDFGRTGRQRKVIMAMMDKIRNLSVLELNNLLNKLLPLVTTDLTDAEILGYAMELLPILKYLSVESQQIPAKGAYKAATINKKSVLVPDLKKNKQILQNIMATE